MPRTVVKYGVNRVQPQAVDMELLDPVECVADEEVPHCIAARAIEVDSRAPRRFVPLGEEARSIKGQVIPVGPEVVVDTIEKHHQTARMSRLDQCFQILGAAIC